MKKHKRPDAQKLRQSENVPGTEKPQGLRRCGRETENGFHICYSPTKSGQRQRTSRYRIGGTKRININLKSAIDFAKSIGLPLVARCIIHWVGTDAGDDADGELFAEVRETFSRWLRYRGVAFAGIWVREKKAGGMAEVEHSHLLFHLPDAWLKDAGLVSVSGEVDGSDELLEVQTAFYRIVRRCVGHPDDYAVKLKIPTAGGNPGPYNERSYDGLYLLKGGGKPAWRLFPRIKNEWRSRRA